MKVALVYDRVNKWGGAERLLIALHQIWPQALLYTAVYDPQKASWAKVFHIKTSWLNHLPLAKGHHELYSFLMPLAFESFDFSQYEVVISITSEAAKGIITKPETLHLCYCLTPTRYLYSHHQDYFNQPVKNFFSQPIVKYLHYWDQIAGQRPDKYLAISKNIQTRIKKYYQRESEVIYPPIETTMFQYSNDPMLQKSYFLIVSRLVKYKKIDIAIEAFNRLKLPLKIVGIGQEMKRLKKLAQKNIEFLGQLTDKQLISYYQTCQAVIYPQEEDLGLVPLEAQGCGRPVIAFRAGGALETIVEGKTGRFFYPQTVEALVKTVKKFASLKFRPEDCRQNALKFDIEIFKKLFKKIVEEKWKNFQNLKKS